MSKRTLKVGQVGIGFMGRVHAGSYNDANEFYGNSRTPTYNLHTVCSSSGNGLSEFAGLFGFDKTTRNWQDIINDPEIDIVDICATNHMHEEIAVAAAAAGKRVFIEKPLGKDVASARRINTAVTSGGQRSLVGLCYRGISAVQEMRASIFGGAHFAFNQGTRMFTYTDYGKGLAGRIHEGCSIFDQDWGIDPLTTNFRFFEKFVGKGGIVGDLGEHELDGQVFTLGQFPTHVSANTFVVHDQRPDPTWVKPSDDPEAKAPLISTGGAIDSYRATLIYPGGINSTAGSTRFRRGRKADYRLGWYGEDCSKTWGLETGNYLQSYLHALRVPGSNTRTPIPSGQRGWTNVQCTNGEHAGIGAFTVSGLENAYRDSFTVLFAQYAHAEAGLIPWDQCHFATVEHATKIACINDAIVRSGDLKGQQVAIDYTTTSA